MMWNWHCVGTLVYADNIFASTCVSSLLSRCENELLNLDMCPNVRNSVYTFIGPRYKNKKASIRWRQFQAVFPVITSSLSTNIIAHLHGLSMDLTVGRTVGTAVDSTVGWTVGLTVKLGATLRWFTAGGAIRIAVRQLSQTWKLRHYDVITRKL